MNVKITLTIKEIKSLLNGLELAAMQMEDTEGRWEMKDLGVNIFNQLSDKELDKFRE